MDSLTIIILGILFLVLAWFAILIFRERGQQESEAASSRGDDGDLPPLDPGADEMGMYHQLMGEYADMLKKLRERVRALDDPEVSPPQVPAIPTLSPDDLSLGAEPVREKCVTPPLTRDGDPQFTPGSRAPQVDHLSPVDHLTDMKIENIDLQRKLAETELRTQRLEEEVATLTATIAQHEKNVRHYRDMIRGLQGNFTVLNKYNYRLCAKNPGTGEWEYRLIKLPPDFDPFSPTTITADGIEIFEDYSLEVPTRLGDIIRREVSRGDTGEYPPYWVPAPEMGGKEDHIQWEIKRGKQ